MDAPAGLQPAAVAGGGVAAAVGGAPAARGPAVTGGFAALSADARKGVAPRATVQVLKAVEKPAVKPAAAADPADPAAATAAAPLDADQVAAAVEGGYPGDNTTPEYARWLAAGAQAAGLPPSSRSWRRSRSRACATSRAATADSIGFFQMRTSIWNQGEYTGYGQQPDLQLKWFINQALAIKAAAPGARRDRVRCRAEQVGASGSPTSSGRRRTTAVATSSASKRPTACSEPG